MWKPHGDTSRRKSLHSLNYVGHTAVKYQFCVPNRMFWIRNLVESVRMMMWWMCVGRWQKHSQRKYFDVKGRKQRKAGTKLHYGNLQFCSTQMRDMIHAQRNCVGKAVIEFRFKTKVTDIFCYYHSSASSKRWMGGERQQM